MIQAYLYISCVLCIKDEVDINVSDKNGKTPLMLAVGRKHEKVIAYLKKELKQRSSLIPRIDAWWVVHYGLTNIGLGKGSWAHKAILICNLSADSQIPVGSARTWTSAIASEDIVRGNLFIHDDIGIMALFVLFILVTLVLLHIYDIYVVMCLVQYWDLLCLSFNVLKLGPKFGKFCFWGIIVVDNYHTGCQSRLV